jgi:putative ABC transport system substrate-binding protein
MKAARLLLTIGLLLAALAAPRAAQAQPPAKVYRIGYLNLIAPDRPEARPFVDAFRQALGELGYVEGRNFVFEHRWSDGRIERLPALAGELAALNVDVIVTPATPQARAAKQATSTIPIVAWAMQDPVKDGLVASLARPGGNLTGLTFLGSELVAKRLALLKEALPAVSRVAALWHPGSYAAHTSQDMAKEANEAARRLGIALQFVDVNAPGELEGAFSTITRERAGAVIVFPSSMLFAERNRIAALAARHRLPAAYNAREFAEAGGLMTYGASLPALVRRAASYVDRILKGAKPADLPVEQPTKYELVINLKTARALGLAIPRSVLAQADEIIE